MKSSAIYNSNRSCVLVEDYIASCMMCETASVGMKSEQAEIAKA